METFLRFIQVLIISTMFLFIDCIMHSMFPYVAPSLLLCYFLVDQLNEPSYFDIIAQLILLCIESLYVLESAVIPLPVLIFMPFLITRLRHVTNEILIPIGLIAIFILIKNYFIEPVIFGTMPAINYTIWQLCANIISTLILLKFLRRQTRQSLNAVR